MSARTVRVPGPWAAAPAAPLRRLGPPPRLGEHDGDADRMLSRPRPTLRPGQQIGRALEGLRVLDFSWVVAGPMGTRLLADHGATVVHVESERRVDVIRASDPFLPDKGGIEDTALWHLIGAGKYSVQLDLGTERGCAIARDFARWADVVVESFTPGTLAASIAGFKEITGWPDRDPAGPFMAYTDYVSPRFLALVTLAGLDHARRTGRGQHIDLSQAEAAVQLLAPSLLDHEVNRRDVSRAGNDDRRFAPHGVYAAGDPGSDEWIAIACTDDAQWTRLGELIGRADLARLTIEERLARRRELDVLVDTWTTGRDPDELQHVLQRHLVCAHKVQRSADCLNDPQLRHREHFRRVPHAIHGEVVVEGPPTRFSRNAPGPAWGGPTLGQHTALGPRAAARLRRRCHHRADRDRRPALRDLRIYRPRCSRGSMRTVRATHGEATMTATAAAAP